MALTSREQAWFGVAIRQPIRAVGWVVLQGWARLVFWRRWRARHNLTLMVLGVSHHEVSILVKHPIRRVEWVIEAGLIVVPRHARRSSPAAQTGSQTRCRGSLMPIQAPVGS